MGGGIVRVGSKPSRRQYPIGFPILLIGCTLALAFITLYIFGSLSTSGSLFPSQVEYGQKVKPIQSLSGDQEYGYNGASDDKGGEGEWRGGGLNSTDQSSSNFALQPGEHIFREPTTIQLEWNITLENRYPDGVKREVFLINGQFPGPTIEARSGDELVVDVLNSVANATQQLSIHWHGLSMKGANEMDGAVGVTQRAIAKGEKLRYRFRIGDDESGTFWYHAHSGVQRADGLYGGLVVHKPAEEGASANKGDEILPEQLLLIGDWYHRPSEDVLAWFLDHQHYGYELAPDSLLINGKGVYNCSLAVEANPIECTPLPPFNITFIGNEKVKLRIVNTGASAGLTLIFSQARLQLISVDADYPVADNTPIARSIGVLYPGERIDIVVERIQARSYDDDPGNLLTIVLDNENMKLINFALDPAQSFPLIWPKLDPIDSRRDNSKTESSTPEDDGLGHLDLYTISGRLSAGDSISAVEPKNHFEVYAQMKISGRTMSPTGSINHTSWLVADVAAAPVLALPSKDWGDVVALPSPKEKLIVPELPLLSDGEYIDFVVHNYDDAGHPFHLHGYQFYVLARTGASIKLHNDNLVGGDATLGLLRKDTVYIPGRGAVTLRMSTSNPGLWLLHCHVLWHQAAGMGIVVQVGGFQPNTKLAQAIKS